MARHAVIIKDMRDEARRLTEYAKLTDASAVELEHRAAIERISASTFRAQSAALIAAADSLESIG